MTNAANVGSSEYAKMPPAKATGGGAAHDDFYVGYLPTPKSHTSTLRVVVPAIVLGLAGVACVVALVQRDPGGAMWSADVERLRGTVLAEPVPMLIVDSAEGPRALLLVEEGKHGARERVANLHERQIEVAGRRLSREGRTVLEIAAGESSMRALDEVASVASVQRGDAAMPGQRVTLRGEIIDSKCYHGAMRPGEGKSHKACATLCVSNGIPAMFATMDADGSTAYYLLTLRDRGEAGAGAAKQFDDDTLSKIGELVEVSGEVSRVADLNVLTIEAGSVARVR